MSINPSLQAAHWAFWMSPLHSAPERVWVVKVETRFGGDEWGQEAMIRRAGGAMATGVPGDQLTALRSVDKSGYKEQSHG